MSIKVKPIKTGKPDPLQLWVELHNRNYYCCVVVVVVVSSSRTDIKTPPETGNKIISIGIIVWLI